jgi:hypothetical protein
VSTCSSILMECCSVYSLEYSGKTHGC